MDKVDKKIIQLLSKGYITPEISAYFVKNDLTPSSVSSIEKRIKMIKRKLGAKTLFHLAVILNNKK
ncbi:helix-turn-helix transcriptional regulator [Cellulophaga sp. Ld12]|uniref:helix-turn-helix transcriptional regulator n=1 Tax=Cellulophaga sp. Ld12 TaxID=3229535 RepID=UPI003865449D